MIANGQKLGPMRVWKKGAKLPGLMMTRSFGDDLGHQCGIISDPGRENLIIFCLEFTELRWDESVVGLIVGSDGLFEMMENESILANLESYPEIGQCEDALTLLVKRAIIKWKIVSNCRC